MTKSALRRKIYEYDFAIHELVLYLDSHPTCPKGTALLKEYRAMRKQLVEEFEKMFGKYILTANDAPLDTGCFEWLNGPWPWENGFMEE